MLRLCALAVDQGGCYDQVLILEDDIDTDLDLRKMWSQYYESVKDHDWDILFPGHCTELGRRVEGITGWYHPDHIACTHSYVIKRSFAEKFLAYDLKHLSTVDWDIGKVCKDIGC